MSARWTTLCLWVLLAATLFATGGFADDQKQVTVLLLSGHDLTKEQLTLEWTDQVALVDGKVLALGNKAQLAFGETITVHSGGASFEAKRIELSPNSSNASVQLSTADLKPRRFPGGVRIQRYKGAWEILNRLDAETYTAAVVDAETIHKDAPYLEALAIVVRTRAAAGGPHTHRAFCDRTCCMVYKGAGGPEAVKAAQATASEVLVYRGKLCPAYFHACCGGETRSVKDAFANAAPIAPLAGVSDRNELGRAWCRDDPHFYWDREIDEKKMSEIATGFFREKKSIGLLPPIFIERRKDGDPLVIRDAKGVYTAHPESFRNFLGRSIGWNLLFSDRFVLLHEKGKYLVRGNGFGHRVGFCQAGALARSRAKQSRADLLKTYFPGASVLPLDALR